MVQRRQSTYSQRAVCNSSLPYLKLTRPLICPKSFIISWSPDSYHSKGKSQSLSSLLSSLSQISSFLEVGGIDIFDGWFNCQKVACSNHVWVIKIVGASSSYISADKGENKEGCSLCVKPIGCTGILLPKYRPQRHKQKKRDNSQGQL